MASHNAPGQLLGYLYQVRYALNLLMESDEEDYQISLEKFDDVAFESDGNPVQLIQVKHHVNPGSLANTSVDLWRTLNVWLDAIVADRSLLEHTTFVIITTASVPEDSVAALIQTGGILRAYDELRAVADSPSQTIQPYCDKFLRADAEDVRELLRRTKIVSSADNVVDVEQMIRRQMRYACNPARTEHLRVAVERVEGWWYEECIRALMSPEPTIMTQRQLHSKIYEITRQYDDDNLPIEFRVLDADETSLAASDRVFLEQVMLLQRRNDKLRFAIRDYYRAFRQRSSWVREGLLYANELDNYESRLIDEWERTFADMEEDLEDRGSPTEKDKVRAGRELYRTTMDKDIRIRDRVNEAYVMRGTYHILANHLKVGWHVDFKERLRHLVGEERSS